MALTLLRFLETKRPLLPVSFSPCQTVACGGDLDGDRVGVSGGKTAVAAVMPPSADDYRLLFTESGEPGLRPVILTILPVRSSSSNR